MKTRDGKTTFPAQAQPNSVMVEIAIAVRLLAGAIRESTDVGLKMLALMEKQAARVAIADEKRTILGPRPSAEKCRRGECSCGKKRTPGSPTARGRQ